MEVAVVPLSKMTAGVFGAVYTLAGLVGFAVTGFSGSGTLIVFDVSVLHNIVHLAIGGGGGGARSSAATTPRLFAPAFCGGVGGAAGGCLAVSPPPPPLLPP